MKNRLQATARAGFTLIEVLVTLVLIALLVGVIVPSVISQLDRGEPTRIASDLEAMRSGTKMFRVDVKRFPAYAHQLILVPAEWDAAGDVRDDSVDINTNTIPDNLLARWEGPYLELGEMSGANSDSVEIGVGAMVATDFITAQWDGATGPDWIIAKVFSVTQDQTQEISLVVDGDTDDTSGRVRWNTDHLEFYMAPIN